MIKILFLVVIIALFLSGCAPQREYSDYQMINSDYAQVVCDNSNAIREAVKYVERETNRKVISWEVVDTYGQTIVVDMELEK